MPAFWVTGQPQLSYCPAVWPQLSETAAAPWVKAWHTYEICSVWCSESCLTLGEAPLGLREDVSQLPCPATSLWCALAVLGDNPLERVGWWFRGILTHVAVHTWPLNLFKNFPGLSLLLSMVYFCPSCHFTRNESRCWPFFGGGVREGRAWHIQTFWQPQFPDMF